VREDEAWFIHRIRRLEGCCLHATRDADPVSRRMLVAATACAVAVTAGAVWTTSSGAQAPATAPALGWRGVRLGAASGFLALPSHPRALAIAIHGDRATKPDVLALTRALRMSGGSATLRVIPGATHGFAFGAAAGPLVWDDVASFLRHLHLAN
jgi:acetyl esterase/lipase